MQVSAILFFALKTKVDRSITSYTKNYYKNIYSNPCIYNNVIKDKR